MTDHAASAERPPRLEPEATPARPWIDAWHDALYGEHGFYSRDEGPAGHFATSAQGIPGVADVLAQTVAALAERHDAEVVVDFACGRGELATSLLPFVEPGVELVAVDVVDRPATLDARVTWLRSPGSASVAPLDLLRGRRALVIAHEWLDVVPCTIAEADDAGVLREVFVDSDGDESLRAPLTGRDLEWARAQGAGADVEPGTRIEIGAPRDAAWTSLVTQTARYAAPGSVVLGVDYAYRTVERPPLGTLTGFREGTQCPPTPDGTCDLTAHVALDSLDVDAVTTQRDVMLELFGDAPLAPVSLDLARSDPPAYLERLAVRSALATAVHPDGLGAFAWFTRTV